jgi:hypothetical protein
MNAGNDFRANLPRLCAATVLLFLVFLLPAQSLCAEEKESVQLPVTGEEYQTAFQILESYVQGRQLPLEPTGCGWPVVGTVVGVGTNIGLTWVSLLPAVEGWSQVDDDYGGIGIYTGFPVGFSAHLLARSIARLAFPPADVRAVYSSVLDVVDPLQRERAALEALKDFSDRARKRRILGGILSGAAIVAPIAVHLGISASSGRLDEYSTLATVFALSTGACLLGSSYYFRDDQPAMLYHKYQGQNHE